MMDTSEGLAKGMPVESRGSGITVPVGERTLGRMFNVLGEAIDGGAEIDGKEAWCIHRKAPAFEKQSPAVEVLETGVDTGTDTQYCDRAWRIFHLYRRG